MPFMILTALGQSGFQIPVTPLLIYALFALLIAVWGIFSWIIHYHWKHYGTSRATTFTMSFVYIVGSAILLSLVGLSALSFAVSAQ
jgi:hypothetical protein